MSPEQGLTARDFAILGAAFEPNEIGSNNGKPYVKARAIKKRLRMVDPNYTTDIDTYIQVIGDVVTVWGGLTIKGVRHAASKSKNVNCWRKQQDGSYTRVDDYEYARELSFAVMKAQSGLLQRAAETFDVGDYLKDKQSPPPPSLATVLVNINQPAPAGPHPLNVTQLPTTTPPPAPEPEKETPKHWALNGDGEKIKQRMNQLGLVWADLQSALEPGKALAKLSDTTLAYDQVYHRMDEIKAAKVADELEAKRKEEQPKTGELVVRGDDLQVNDLIYGLNGRGGTAKRLMKRLGETIDGRFIEWVVWSQTRFTNVERLPFEKEMKFKVERRAHGDLVAPPKEVLNQVEQLVEVYEPH